LRPMGSDVVEDGTGRRAPEGYSGASQTVFGPNCANLFVRREFATSPGCF
jgi:hypothetical protein